MGVFPWCNALTMLSVSSTSTTCAYTHTHTHTHTHTVRYLTANVEGHLASVLADEVKKVMVGMRNDMHGYFGFRGIEDNSKVVGHHYTRAALLNVFRGIGGTS